jgi:hypothetical protein
MILKSCQKDLKRKTEKPSGPSPPPLQQCFKAAAVDLAAGDETTWDVVDVKRRVEAEDPPKWHAGQEEETPPEQ